MGLLILFEQQQCHLSNLLIYIINKTTSSPNSASREIRAFSYPQSSVEYHRMLLQMDCVSHVPFPTFCQTLLLADTCISVLPQVAPVLHVSSLVPGQRNKLINRSSKGNTEDILEASTREKHDQLVLDSLKSPDGPHIMYLSPTNYKSVLLWGSTHVSMGKIEYYMLKQSVNYFFY